MMQRIAFTMKIMPVSEAEYRTRHQQVWLELLADLKQAGCSRYSIYLRGLDLFAYMEVDDFQRYLSLWATIQAARCWEERMSDILIREVDPATGFPNVFLKCFFWIEPRDSISDDREQTTFPLEFKHWCHPFSCFSTMKQGD